MIPLGHLPKQYTIELSEFMESLKATLNHLTTPEQIEQVLPVLLNEFSYSLISDEPDMIEVEVPETAMHLNALQFPYAQFVHLKQVFYRYYLSRHITSIDKIILMWKEHCDVDLSWSINKDMSAVSVNFKPKPNYIDLDAIIQEKVDECIEAGKFIPYKYLRVIGKL